MANKPKKIKSTKLYCLRKNNQYLSWDEKSFTEKPQDGFRASRTYAERKYPGYEMIPFPEAYDQWFQAQKGKKA